MAGAWLLPHAQLVEVDDSYTLIPLHRPARLAQAIRDFTGAPRPAEQARR